MLPDIQYLNPDGEQLHKTIYMNGFDHNSVIISSMEDFDESSLFTAKYDFNDFNLYQEYEVYIKKNEENKNKPRQYSEVAEAKNKVENAPAVIKKDKFGPFALRINRSEGEVIYITQEIHLSFYKYNMLTRADEQSFTCLCCDEEIDGKECKRHVETEKHKTRLRNQSYVPHFTDNIIRHIKDNVFHCGICNITVTDENLTTHVEKDVDHNRIKEHCQALYDTVWERIKYGHDYPFSYRITGPNGDMSYSELKVNLNLFHYNMLIPNGDDTYVCLCCNVKIDTMKECRKHVVTANHRVQLRGQEYIKEFYDNIVRRIQNNYLHCGICNDIVSAERMADHVQNEKKHAILKKYSQACVLNTAEFDLKTEIDWNDFEEIQIGDEIILMPKYRWHMCFRLPRKFFCSLCILGGDVDLLEEHLKSSDHLTKLEKCQILPEYGFSVVRTLNEDYYHCGVCNLYTNIPVINNHITRPKHKSYVKLLLEFNEIQTDKTKVDQDIKHGDKELDKAHKTPHMSEKTVIDLPDEDVIVEHNGYKFCLNVLSYNTIVKAKNDFYCVCCSASVDTCELHDHINMEEHKEALNNAEIYTESVDNFVRKFHSKSTVWAHCGFCNTRMTYSIKHIEDHFRTPKHVANSIQRSESLAKNVSETTRNYKLTPKNFVPPTAHYSKSEIFTQNIEILGRKYQLNLHTFKAWHTIRGWGMYFHCCFMCQTLLTHASMYRHTRSAEHKENLKKCIFLECYGTHCLKLIDWTNSVYCMFCNDQVENWDIDSHITSMGHIKKHKIGVTKLENGGEIKSRIPITLQNLLDAKTLKLESKNTEGNNIEPEKVNDICSEVKQHIAPSRVLDDDSKKLDIIIARISHILKVDAYTPEDLKLLTLVEKAQIQHFNIVCEIIDQLKKNTLMQQIDDADNRQITHMKIQDSLNLEVIQKQNIDTSKYLSLNFVKEKMLVSYNAWNSIIEQNNYCKICNKYFKIDIKRHCSEETHKDKLFKKITKLPDGSPGIHASKKKMYCILCASEVKWLSQDRHIELITHVDNFTNSKNAVLYLDKSQLKFESFAYGQYSVLEDFIFLSFDRTEMVVKYESWNWAKENIAICFVCNDRSTRSNQRDVVRHCDSINHKNELTSKPTIDKCIRQIKKNKLQCFLCNFYGTRVQIVDHVKTTIHQDYVTVARILGKKLSNSGILVINYPQYTNNDMDVNNIGSIENIKYNKSKKKHTTNDTGSSEDDDSVYCHGGGNDGLDPTTIETIVVENSVIPVECNKINKVVAQQAYKNNSTPSTTREEGYPKMVDLLEKSKYNSDSDSSDSNDMVIVNRPISSNDLNEKVFEDKLSDSLRLQDDNVIETNIKTEVNGFEEKYCHLCETVVPTQFHMEHVNGENHKNIAKLMEILLERMKKSISHIPSNSRNDSVLENVKYCSTCNCVMSLEEFSKHCHSVVHQYNVNKTIIIRYALDFFERTSLNTKGDNSNLVVSDAIESKSADDKSSEVILENNSLQQNQSASIPITAEIKTEIVEDEIERNGNDFNDSANSITTEKYSTEQNCTDYDEEAILLDLTESEATFRIGVKQMKISTLSYLGIYPKLDHFWCVLCKKSVKNTKKEEHLISDCHIKQLNELKFKGVDLTRYLTNGKAHCAVCHLIMDVTKLKDHLDTEEHKTNRRIATLFPINESTEQDSQKPRVCDRSEDKERRSLETSQATVASDDICGKGSIIKSFYDSKIADTSILDSDRQTESPSMGFHIKLPSVNQLIDIKTTPKFDSNTQNISIAETKPSKSVNQIKLLENSSESQPPLQTIIQNEFISVNAESKDFPYFCSLCDAKLILKHVEDHLVGSRHMTNLRSLNLKSVNTPNTQNQSSSNGFRNQVPSVVRPLDIKTTLKLDSNTQNMSIIEAKPCSSTSYICAVCNVEVPSANEKIAHEKSLDHITNSAAQTVTKSVTLSPLISINDTATLGAQTQPPFKTGIENEFITLNSDLNAQFYLCSLCNAQIPTLNHIEGHLKGSRHMTKLKVLSSKSDNTPNVKTNNNSLLENVSTLTFKNSNGTDFSPNVNIKDSRQSLPIQQDVIADNIVKPVDNGFNTQNITMTETKPCSSTVSNIIVSSINKTLENENSFEHIVNATIQSKNLAQPPSIHYGNVSNDKSLISEKSYVTFDPELKLNPYFCLLCEMPVSSLKNVEEHLRGLRHTQNLENGNLVNQSTQNVTIHPKSSLAYNPIKPEDSHEYACEMCNVKVPKHIWEQHVQGRTHRLKSTEVAQTISTKSANEIANPSNLRAVENFTTDTKILSSSQLPSNYQQVSLVKSCGADTSYKCTVCDVQVSPINEICSSYHIANAKAQITKSQIQPLSIPISQGTVSKSTSKSQLVTKVETKNDFILPNDEPSHLRYRCSLCDVKLPSQRHVEEHLKGALHTHNLKDLNNDFTTKSQTTQPPSIPVSRETIPGSVSNSQPATTITTKNDYILPNDEPPHLRYRCSLCDVKLPLQRHVEEHLKGALHTHNLKDLNNDFTTKSQTTQPQSIPASRETIPGSVSNSQLATTITTKNDYILPNDKPSSLRYRCSLCNVKLSSEYQVREHLKGATHTHNLKAVNTNRLTKSQSRSPSTQLVQSHSSKTSSQLKIFGGDYNFVSLNTNNKNYPYSCSLCNVKINSAISLKVHFGGAGHKQKVQNFKP